MNKAHKIFLYAHIYHRNNTRLQLCNSVRQKHGTVFIVVKVDITNKHVDIHRQSCVIPVVNMGIKKNFVSFIHVRKMAKMTKP
jgi:hypothetical protein